MNWSRSACRHPSGLSPGPAARASPATSSTILTQCEASACSTSPRAGLVAIAAARAGAAEITAADIDPFCATAIRLNSDANGVVNKFLGTDCIGTDADWDVILAGDVFYDKPFADRLMPWFSALKRRGAEVLVGDPGRSYLPRSGLEPLGVYQVPVTRALEDAEVKRTTVWRLLDAIAEQAFP